MRGTVVDYETGDVIFMQYRWTPAFLVSPAVQVLAPVAPVVSDEDAMYEAMAERVGFYDRFDAVSAHFGSD